MQFRIATYNLFEGATASYNRLAEFVRSQEVDVICFQEVNGWQDSDESRCRDFADRALFASYKFGNSNTEFKLATFSKETIQAATVHTERLWHCAVETRVPVGGLEVTVVNVHLDPWQETARLAEVERLLSKLDLSKPTVITGDFNSLSRADNYPADLLQQLIAKGITKFGQTALEYQVTDRLTAAGLVDVAALVQLTETTVPTNAAVDKDHEIPVRLDYMFVTPDLAALVREARVIRNSFTEIISDHYPLVVTFGGTAAATAPSQTTAEPAVSSQPSPVIPAAPQPVVPWTPPEDTPPSSPQPPSTRPVVPWTPPEETPPEETPPSPPSANPNEGVITWRHDD